MKKLNSILLWAAVACGCIAGLVAIIAGIITHKPAAFGWGIAFISGSIIAGVGGARGRPDGKLSPPTIGAKFERIPSGAWFAIAGLFVAATVITFIFPPWQ